jgi:predicted regulator of Ras-like GTPase activity (Roadblock/LC7/MglB family)/Tfp pilus assembly protein PilF
MFEKRKKELQAERKAVESSSTSTPQQYVGLVEKFMAVDDAPAAAEVARLAMKRFPDAEQVQQAFQNVRRLELQGQIQQLQKAIAAGRAGAGEYERLAVIYNQELGNKNKAYEAARDGLNRYKKAAGLHLLCGQIRMERYRDDSLANDWMEAREHLQRAIELNPSATMARLHLAQLYVMAGLHGSAKPIVDQLRAEAATEEVERLAGVIAAAPPDDPSVDLETRLGRLEKGREVKVEPGGGGEAVRAAGQVPKNVLEAYVKRLEKIDGFKAAGILTVEGTPLAVSCRVRELQEGFIELIRSVYEASESASHRMDIGSFVNGEIDTPRGTLSVSESNELVLGILAGEPAKATQLRRAAEEFTAIARPA